ncbi:hypothetical protein AK812_SmicGene6810 [Symbiodinium microadriaticum]|uniref:Ion transport domain-containing protein n=1 Tax=Symbiodinium microadriaticum TaxID=2951 RepID=A0A1Q9EQ93_SYMMI|nr:hypothetical protein AK812_SmicGene6810 [Symbiodinium microadriaticum]
MSNDSHQLPIKVSGYLSALRTIVFSIVSTMSSVGWTSLLLVVLFYLFGVLLTQISTDHCRDLKYTSGDSCDDQLNRFWSSVPQSMLTLFLSITNGISWDEAGYTCAVQQGAKEALQPLRQISDIAVVGLLIYIAVTGVFCNMAIESARADKDIATMQQMQKHEAQVEALREVFREINTDRMEIATDDIVTLFMWYGCMNLAGPAKGLQVARMGYESTIIRKEIKAMREDLHFEDSGLISPKLRTSSLLHARPAVFQRLVAKGHGGDLALQTWTVYRRPSLPLAEHRHVAAVSGAAPAWSGEAPFATPLTLTLP